MIPNKISTNATLTVDVTLDWKYEILDFCSFSIIVSFCQNPKGHSLGNFVQIYNFTYPFVNYLLFFKAFRLFFSPQRSRNRT